MFFVTLDPESSVSPPTDITMRTCSTQKVHLEEKQKKKNFSAHPYSFIRSDFFTDNIVIILHEMRGVT